MLLENAKNVLDLVIFILIILQWPHFRRDNRNDYEHLIFALWFRNLFNSN